MADQNLNKTASFEESSDAVNKDKPPRRVPSIVNFRHDSISKIDIPNELAKSTDLADTMEEDPSKLPETGGEESSSQQQETSSKSKKKKSKKRNMKGKNERQKEKLKSLQQQFEEVEEENKLLKRNLQESKSRKDTDSSGKEQLQKMITKMNKEMGALKKTLESREMELKTENVELQEKITLELNEKMKLAQHLEEIQSESSQVKEECTRLKSCAEDFKKELDALNKTKKTKPDLPPNDHPTKEDKSQQGTGGDELKEKFQKIAKNLKMSESQREELKAANEQIKSELSKEKEEKNKLSQQLKTIESEMAKMKEECLKLNQDADKLREELKAGAQSKPDSSVEEHKKKITELLTNLKMSESQREELKAANEQITSELSKEKEEKNKLSQQLKTIESETAKMKEECLKLNQDADKLRVELKAGAQSKPDSSVEEHKKKITELLTNLKMSESQREELKAANEQIKSELSKEKEGNNKLSQQLKTIESGMAKMKEECLKLNQDADKLREELKAGAQSKPDSSVEEHKKKITELLTNLKTAKVHQEESNAAIEGFKTELKNGKEENFKLNQQLKMLQSEAIKMKEECQRLNLDADKLKKELKEGFQNKLNQNEEDLKRNIDELLTNLKNCEIDRAKYKSENSTLEDRLRQEVAEKQELMQRFEGFKAEFKQMQEGFTRARTESEALKQRLNEVTSRIKQKEEELNESLGASDQVRAEMKKEILSLRQQLTMVNMDKTHASSQLTTAQNKIKQLTDECSRFKSAADNMSKKHDRLRLKSKSDTEAAEKSVRDELEKSKNELQTQIGDLYKNLEESRRLQGELTNENSNLRREIDEYKVQHQQLQQKQNDDDMESWVQVNKDDSSNISEEAFKKEKQALTSTIEQMNNEMQSLKSTHTELRNENDQLRGEVDQTLLRNQQLTDQLKSAQSETEQLKKKCSSLEASNKELRGDSDVISSPQLNSELQALRSENRLIKEASAREKGSLERKIKELTAELEQLKVGSH